MNIFLLKSRIFEFYNVSNVDFFYLELLIMQVLKFGGTSVGSVERIKAIPDLLNQKDRQVIVLSAMSGTTNKLELISNCLTNGEIQNAISQIEDLGLNYIEVAKALFSTNKIKDATIDFINDKFQALQQIANRVFSIEAAKEIMAQGELLSTYLLYNYMLEVGYNVALIPALDFMRLDKDQELDQYYISENLKRKIAEYPDCNLFITQGYICRDYKGDIDNLKRGGSDYSASIIGAAIKAENIQIWTDIDGVHNNDPRFVENTYSISEMSFDEAAELAYFGAKILHPTSIQPAQKENIPVYLKNTMQPDAQGTLISSKSSEVKIKAVAAKDGIIAIKIKSSRMLMAYGFLKKVFQVFEQYETPIDMITTSEIAVSVTIDDDSNLKYILEDLSLFATIEVDNNQTIICVVGNLIANHKGIAGKIFTALENIPIRMISYGGSHHNISLLINTNDKKKALNELNQHLF